MTDVSTGRTSIKFPLVSGTKDVGSIQILIIWSRVWGVSLNFIPRWKLTVA